MKTTTHLRPNLPALFHLWLTNLLALAMGTAFPVCAATVSWDGGGGNNSWQTAANWSGNVLPGPNDDVVIDIPGDGTVVHGGGGREDEG